MFYRFPDAPKGTYAIDFGFAEIEKVAKGKRVFDVLVDGALTDYAYDPAAAVGPNAADWRAPSSARGRSADRGAAGLEGLKAPTIAALRVTLDPREDRRSRSLSPRSRSQVPCRWPPPVARTR